MASSPIDPAVAQRILADLGPEVRQTLIDGFAEEILARIDALERAQEAGDQEQTRSEAHAIRSASVEYGAVELASMAGEIEAGNAIASESLKQCGIETAAALRAL